MAETTPLWERYAMGLIPKAAPREFSDGERKVRAMLEKRGLGQNQIDLLIEGMKLR